MITHNDDVDWDRWPVADYLAENYREVHPCDAAVIAHHSAFYRRLPPRSLGRSVEFGAGPNVYPLILAAAASRRVEAVEAGAGNVAYLEQQILDGPDASWLPFHDLCRRLNPGLPATLAGALAPVHVVHADVRDLRCVAPGGYLVAAFMENMPTYRIGPASRWPGCPVDPDIVSEVFAPLTRELAVTRIDADPTLPDYGDSGMVLLAGRAR